MPWCTVGAQEGDAKTNSRFSHASQASHSTSRRDTIRVQTAEELGVSLEEYRQQLAQAKLIGAMKFMQMGKVGIDACHKPPAHKRWFKDKSV
eukprot:g9368.t1